MSKPTAAKSNYRLRYNPKLRASLEAKLRAPHARRKSSRKVLLVVTLLILMVGAVAGTIYGINLYGQAARQVAGEPENRPKDNESASQSKGVLASAALPKATEPIFPYSKTIGFVGDSLTFGCCKDATPAPTDEVDALGSGYKAINRGVNGSTTRDWLNTLLSPAMAEFKKQNVEVVQVMLGTNDVIAGIPTDESINNLQTIADRLVDNGAKLVMINKVPYSRDRDDLKMRQLNTMIERLPDNQQIFLGDEDSYDYFYLHQDELEDGTHMTEQGYKSLAKLWTTALRQAVAESMNQ